MFNLNLTFYFQPRLLTLLPPLPPLLRQYRSHLVKLRFENIHEIARYMVQGDFQFTKIDSQDFQFAEIKATAQGYIVPHFLSLRK